MKNIFKFILIFTLLVGTASCRQNRQPYHDVVYNQNGEQMVKVQDYDANGNLIEYYIAYAMFNQLYNNGGYRSVNSYYYNNRPNFDRGYENYERSYSYDRNPIQPPVEASQPIPNTYRKSAPSGISPTQSETTNTNTYKAVTPSTNTYRASAPVGTTYRASAPKPASKPVVSSSTSSYRTSAPSSSYKSSSSTYRSSAPSSASSSYRSSSPSSSYKSSSSSSSSYRSSAPSSSSRSSSSSSYRSSAPRH